MLIRADQMDAFNDVAELGFIKRVTKTLQTDHGEAIVRLPDKELPVAIMQPEGVEELVRHGLARAKQYELEDEASLAAFILLMFETAPNFDEHPLLRRFLEDENVQIDARVDNLMDRATEQNWDVVRKNYNPEAWTAPLQAKVA